MMSSAVYFGSSESSAYAERDASESWSGSPGGSAPNVGRVPGLGSPEPWKTEENSGGDSYPPFRSEVALRPLTDRWSSPPKEGTALKAYCQAKIRRVKVSANRSLPARHLQRAPEPSADPEGCPVPLHFIATLKLKSFTARLKQLSRVDMHTPSHCRACQDQQAKLATHTFIRTKTSQLESQLMKEKLDLHIYNNSSISLVGELLRSLPKSSDDPVKIWRALGARERWNPR
ncbi:uncharacterized protein C8orf48 homolog isoform X2 [Brienomyrus brachyistius]|nr:uncharacterized protein C8orf48 homolog isoform X2 [Brienomyrus brachyistius]XP_048885051.1 uncharacterized protein C8orf48 homolog isoform X2 [Brienomyrus brachyistius]XP_048885052.1 uncharacterized protein C8orf48 homolog isoform X2 [Brienomyrus brachyistius]XP_048885053.1 uncharacterized protein C8orf48 homolog isoform X2 [Brienomyrus brachyistius]